MPKRKTSIGPQQLDCSDGAKLLIDQMKEHPEEFKGYSGKFTNLLDTARQAAQGLSRDAKMSARDAKAIIAAAEEHLYEVWLAEDVLVGIMQPKPEPEVAKAWYTTQGPRAGKSVLGQMAGATISNSVFVDNNTITDQYDRVYRMEQERYKLELAKHEREAFERQEREHAIRNTKPYRPFL